MPMKGGRCVAVLKAGTATRMPGSVKNLSARSNPVVNEALAPMGRASTES